MRLLTHITIDFWCPHPPWCLMSYTHQNSSTNFFLKKRYHKHNGKINFTNGSNLQLAELNEAKTFAVTINKVETKKYNHTCLSITRKSFRKPSGRSNSGLLPNQYLHLRFFFLGNSIFP